jgi:hypothetical protein
VQHMNLSCIIAERLLKWSLFGPFYTEYSIAPAALGTPIWDVTGWIEEGICQWMGGCAKNRHSLYLIWLLTSLCGILVSLIELVTQKFLDVPL